jgi:hypothetical protein
MGEMRLLMDKTVSYQGLFRMDELYKTIMKSMQERGYFIIEKRNQEDVFEEGKQIVLQIEPVKTLNDYAKSRMKIKLTANNLKDKVVKIDGHPQKLQQGKVDMQFFAVLETDYRNKWQDSGFKLVFRTISDKFIRHDIIHKAEDGTKADCVAITEEVKAYLNMHRYQLDQQGK